MTLDHIYNENCLTALANLPAKTVQMCVTSPPYYGLRDYGTGRWEGGDDNCTHQPADTPQKRGIEGSTLQGGKKHTGHQQEGYAGTCARCGAIRIDHQLGLEPTPEAYVANMVAVFREVRRVLKNDGVLWLNIGDSYWGGKGQSAQAWSTEMVGKRQTINGQQHQISSKGQTRPTDGKHETIKPKDLIGIPWLLAFALRADGWYLRQDIIWHKPNPMPESVTDRCTKAHEYIFLLSKSERYFYDADAIRQPYAPKTYTTHGCSLGNAEKYGDGSGLIAAQNWASTVKKHKPHPTGKANCRSVWTIATQPYPEAHFATFPPDLIIPCIKAGSKPGDIILDPFMGSGTTAEVALRLQRHYIGYEINPQYIQLAEKRLRPHKFNLFTPSTVHPQPSTVE